MSNQPSSGPEAERIVVRRVHHRSFRLTGPGEPPASFSLRTKVPWDFRTAVLCFLIGSILSVPLGFVQAVTIQPFDPPAWIARLYTYAVVASFAVLPFWSYLVLRREPVLSEIGRSIFWIALILVILFSLICPINAAT